jgi:hypothetical protein
MNPEAPPRFDIERAVVHQVSTINDGIAKLDLLPSSIKLISLQDRISMIALQNNYASKPIDILKEALDPIIGRYNYVIIGRSLARRVPALGIVATKVQKNNLHNPLHCRSPREPSWAIRRRCDAAAAAFVRGDRPASVGLQLKVALRARRSRRRRVCGNQNDTTACCAIGRS